MDHERKREKAKDWEILCRSICSHCAAHICFLYNVLSTLWNCFLSAASHPTPLSVSLSLCSLHTKPSSWLHSFVSMNSLLKRSFSAQHEEDFHLRTLDVMTISTLWIWEKCFCTLHARAILGRLLGKLRAEASWNFLGRFCLYYPPAHVPAHVWLWLPFNKMTHFWFLKSPSNDLATLWGHVLYDISALLMA